MDMTEERSEDDGTRCEDSCACEADGLSETSTKPTDASLKTDKVPDVESCTNDSAPPRSELDECKDKLMRTMADYENMMRQKDGDIAMRVAAGVNSVMADLLQIHDDIERAHDAFASSEDVASGLGGILKNIRALLTKYGITEINALGEHFDPDKHESIKVVDDDSLDDGTVTSIIRKGYICRNQILRPSLVEISRRESG